MSLLTRRAVMTALAVVAMLSLAGCDLVVAFIRAMVLLFILLSCIGVATELVILVGAAVSLRRRSRALLPFTVIAFLLAAAHGYLVALTLADTRSMGSVESYDVAIVFTFLLPLFTAVLGLTGLLARRSSRPGALAAGIALLAAGAAGAGLAGALALPSELPVAPGGIAGVAAGAVHGCVLVDDGRVLCWGDNHEGELGSGPNPVRRAKLAPVVGLEGVTQIVAGQGHTCALRGGEVWCWGHNDDGQLGPDAPATSALPRRLPGIGDAVEIFDEEGALLIRTAGGHLLGFGPHFADYALPPGCAIPADTVETAPARGGLCVRRRAGGVACCDAEHAMTEVPIGAAVRLAAGSEQVCAVRAAGDVWCWEPRTLGYAFERARRDRDAACEFARTRAGAVAKARRRGKAPAADPPECTGEDAPLAPSAVAHPVTGVASVVSLAAGSQHFCAVSRDGRVRCWGSGQYGELGDGKLSGSDDPVEASLPAAARAAAVYAGDGVSCARTEDGDVYGWGKGLPGLESATVCSGSFLGLPAGCAVPRPARIDALRVLGR